MTVFDNQSFSGSGGGSLPVKGPPGSTDVTASLMRSVSRSRSTTSTTTTTAVPDAGPTAPEAAATASTPPPAPDAGTTDESEMTKFIAEAVKSIEISTENEVDNHDVASIVEQAAALTPPGSATEKHLNNALSAIKGGDSSAGSNTKARSQDFHVPIDEKKDLTLLVSPTYDKDTVTSITLKSFRKIVGYDTFESIRRKNRSEDKGISDYYNVTISMMVQRLPVSAASAPAKDPYNPDGGPSLAASLDKGFPYDD